MAPLGPRPDSIRIQGFREPPNCRTLHLEVHYPEEPIGKLHRTHEQFLSEVTEGHVPAGHNQHHTQCRKVDEVNNHHRKEGAVLDQVGLSLPQHPDGKGDMKTPGKADDREEQAPERFHIYEQANPPVQKEGQNAVDRKKIRRQRDPEIVRVGDDVPTGAADPELAHPASHQPGPEGVRKFMPEDVQ